MLGEKSIWQQHKTAFLCSDKFSAGSVLKSYDWATEMKRAERCAISGFQSKLERDVFDLLLGGDSPLIWVLDRRIYDSAPVKYSEHIKAVRLLIASPFADNIKNPHRGLAIRRRQGKGVVKMSIQTITSLSTSQPPGNTLDLSSVLDFAKEVLAPIVIIIGFIGIVITVVVRCVLYVRKRNEILKRAQEKNQFSKTEIKAFIPPLLFLHNTKGISDIGESLSYRKIVKYIAEREYPLKGNRKTSPIYFVFANPACGKTKFAQNLCTRLTLRYWRKNYIITYANKKTGEIHDIDPVSTVSLVLCRKSSFEEVKENISKSKNSVLIFDGFDELRPESSIVDNVVWRKERLFEIIDMLEKEDNNNTIVITYRTADNADLKSEIATKSLSDRKITRLEICEYNQDYVPEKVAIKYAKKVFAVNIRKYVLNGDDRDYEGRITFWQKEKIKKAIKTLYRAKNTDGKRTGKFIALPLYSAYASILLDEQDLEQLSKTSYFQKMVDVFLGRECDKYCRNEAQAEKDKFKENLKKKLIELAAYFVSQKIFEISSSDPMIEQLNPNFPTLFLQYKDKDKKYEFQHEEFITYFSGLGEAEKQKQLPHEIYTILEVDSQLAKGNHLRFSSNPQIIWRILDYKNRENMVLLISDQILSLRAFNKTTHKNKQLNDWETSDIKAYLNSDFLKATFNDMERAKIQDQDKDKIFLLSIDEAQTYFSSNEDRIAYCSETAYDALKSKASTGAYYNEEYINSLNSSEKAAWWWWLRSPGIRDNLAAYVYNDGYLYLFGGNVISAEGGVRPALWLNL